MKLHAGLVEMVWVIMAYILMSTVCLLTFGRIADMFGRVRMYNLGFVIFTAGSALCGLSQNATELIIFRLVQGAGAAFMMVNSPAIIAEVFPPHQRGRALGINGITFALGGIAGPAPGRADPLGRQLALDILHQRAHRNPGHRVGIPGAEGNVGAEQEGKIRPGRSHLVQPRPDRASVRAHPRHPS